MLARMRHACVACLCVLLWPLEAQPTPDSTEIMFVGDVSFAGRRIPSGERLNTTRNPLRDVARVFADADFVVANGEGLLLDTPPTAYHASRLNIDASPRWASIYRAAGVDLVGLANNHTWDGGAEGLLENWQHLVDSGVQVYGAGRTPEEAVAPVILRRDGRCQVAVLPATLKSNRPARKGASAAYYRGAKGLARLAARVQKLHVEGCLVLVSVHWGREGVHLPPKSVIRAAHTLVDAGAGAVIGHHPHVLQGVEFYRGVPIAYSLGNFVFTNRTPAKRETGILSVRVSNKAPFVVQEFALLPATIAIHGGFVPRLSTTKEREATHQHLNEWSRPFGTRVRAEGRALIFEPGSK